MQFDGATEAEALGAEVLFTEALGPAEMEALSAEARQSSPKRAENAEGMASYA